MLVPKLRFKREDGTSYPDIESLMLGERFTFKNGINASREAFRAEGIQCIGVSDVVKCLPITSKNVKGTVAISEEEIKKNIVNYGDILFQRSSETKEDIGYASVYYDKTPAVYNGFVICAKPDKLFYAPIYLHYALQHSRIRKQTVTLGAGTGQHYNIGQEGLARIKVIIPCLEEQQKIAEFLSEVDEVIMQSEAEVQKLEQQKRAAMQKIFSQEICFRREDGEAYPKWKEKQLGLIGKATSGSGFSEKYQGYKDLPIPFYKVSDMNNAGNEIIMSNSNNYVSEELLSTMRLKACHRNSIIFAKVGAALLLDRKRIAISPFLVDNNMMIFTPNNENVLEYVYYWFTNTRLSKYAQVGALPSFNAGDIESITIPLPHIEEQQKIADFLSAYDEAICFARQELEKWKELKKGLLQQMFV